MLQQLTCSGGGAEKKTGEGMEGKVHVAEGGHGAWGRGRLGSGDMAGQVALVGQSTLAAVDLVVAAEKALTALVAMTIPAAQAVAAILAVQVVAANLAAGRNLRQEAFL